MLGRFKNRVALVTGGSRGIGKAIAEEFATEGAQVVILDINATELENVEKEFVERGFDLFTRLSDVTDSTQADETFKAVIDKYGKVDILVNNAGVIRDNLLFKMTDKDWQTVMDVHLKGSFNCSRAAQKYMVSNNYGRIVNISSASALGMRGQANYSAAKAGLQGFTKTLAIELGRFGITSNCVAPGFIETDMTKQTAERLGIPFDDYVNQIVNNIPVGRSGTPRDIANAVLFLCEEASSFINGQVLYVSGGPIN